MLLQTVISSSTTRIFFLSSSISHLLDVHAFRLFFHGQLYLKNRSQANVAFHIDCPAALLDDPVADGQAQPCTEALGREERIEDLLQVLLGDPHPRVGEKDLDVAAGGGR